MTDCRALCRKRSMQEISDFFGCCALYDGGGTGVSLGRGAAYYSLVGMADEVRMQEELGSVVNVMLPNFHVMPLVDLAAAGGRLGVAMPQFWRTGGRRTLRRRTVQEISDFFGCLAVKQRKFNPCVTLCVDPPSPRVAPGGDMEWMVPFVSGILFHPLVKGLRRHDYRQVVEPVGAART